MQYSCPLWAADEGGVSGDLQGHRRRGDLENAQARKLAHLFENAKLRSGYRLLDIGCGWGGLAIAVSLHYAEFIPISSTDDIHRRLGWAVTSMESQHRLNKHKVLQRM